MSAAAPARARPGPRTGARVLLVEDEPGLLRALLIDLRARQYDAVTASTGREALATAAQRPPDAVILDLGLPDIDGTEVIVELRRWSKAPVIVLSGRASPGGKIGAPDVGTGPAAGPAGQFPSAADRDLGTRIRAAHQLPAVPHGPAAAQAGRRSGPSPAPAHRARPGLPVPALSAQHPVTSHSRYAVQ